MRPVFLLVAIAACATTTPPSSSLPETREEPEMTLTFYGICEPGAVVRLERLKSCGRVPEDMTIERFRDYWMPGCCLNAGTCNESSGITESALERCLAALRSQHCDDVAASVTPSACFE